MKFSELIVGNLLEFGPTSLFDLANPLLETGGDAT